MKRILISALFSLMFITATNAQYQTERTGYEGDYFSLEGAIELFKESRSLSQFERKINSKNSYVNNLDLDYNGKIDYIRVEHRRQGDFHAIILQVPIDRHDLQDVAVIEIEKTGRREAVLQIIGDPDLYGEEVVVEPFEGTRYSTGGEYVSDTYINVYYWPIVQNFYARDYVVYASPYRWNYYPNWWVTWRPFSWNVYYTRVRPYYRHCRVVTIYRTPRVHRFYRPHRRYSTHVAHRTERIRVDRAKSHRTYGNNIRRNDHDRYGSGIKRNSPSREIDRRLETKRLDANKRQPVNRDYERSSSRERIATPDRSTNRSDRTYRNPSTSRSKESPRSKVITPRKSSEQVRRNPAPSRQSSAIRERSTSSTQKRNYSKSTTRPKTNSIKRSAPRATKSTPRASQSSKSNTVRSQKTTPARKSSSGTKRSKRN